MDEHHTVWVGRPDDLAESGFARVVAIHNTALADFLENDFVEVEDDGAGGWRPKTGRPARSGSRSSGADGPEEGDA